MQKTLLIIGLLISSFLCSASLYAASTTAASGKLTIVASFDAMAEFARAVGGDKVEVVTLTPAGMEPHEFEPKAQDLVTLSKAALFVYNGLGMEAWADKAISAAGNKKLVVVNASTGSSPISNSDPGEIEEHGHYDPHLWLSLSGAALEAKNIAAALAKVDPKNSSYYSKNLDAFTRALAELRARYSAKLASTKNRSFVTGHAAFAYFCRDFGLEQNSVEDVFAEGEPSAKGLAELVEYCRKNNIKTIFVEDMVSPAVSKALASEVGAKTETIATCEGPEDGKTYLDRQRENLEKVYLALAQ